MCGQGFLITGVSCHDTRRTREEGSRKEVGVSKQIRELGSGYTISICYFTSCMAAEQMNREGKKYSEHAWEPLEHEQRKEKTFLVKALEAGIMA